MTVRNPRILLAASAVATALSLGACAVVPAGPGYSETVTIAPPPPRVEYIGSPPIVGQIWIGGYWNWAGARYVWVPGRWSAPRPGYRWIPHRWERNGDRWHRHDGHWENDRYAPRDNRRWRGGSHRDGWRDRD